MVRRGDWLVDPAQDHRRRATTPTTSWPSHVDWLRAELGDRLGGAEVHGLLIADGASLLLERALRERGFGYLSLPSIGYRHWVRSHTRVAVRATPTPPPSRTRPPCDWVRSRRSRVSPARTAEVHHRGGTAALA